MTKENFLSITLLLTGVMVLRTLDLKTGIKFWYLGKITEKKKKK